MNEHAWVCVASPVGSLHLTAGPVGLASVSFGSPPPAPGTARPGTRAESVLLVAARQLGEYFAGERRAFTVPLDWSALSSARGRVLRILHDRVPFGETVTYGWLARQAELTAEDGTVPARAVGQIMGSNPWPILVPCHRVVAGDGLGGYSGGTGIEVKRWLLIFEGALPPTLDWDPAGLTAVHTESQQAPPAPERPTASRGC